MHDLNYGSRVVFFLPKLPVGTDIIKHCVTGHTTLLLVTITQRDGIFETITEILC